MDCISSGIWFVFYYVLEFTMPYLTWGIAFPLNGVFDFSSYEIRNAALF